MGSVLSVVAKHSSDHLQDLAYFLQCDDPDPLEATNPTNDPAPEPAGPNSYYSNVYLLQAGNAMIGPNYGTVNQIYQRGRDNGPVSAEVVLCNAPTIVPHTSVSEQHNNQDEPKKSRLGTLPSPQSLPNELDIAQHDRSAAGDDMEDMLGEEPVDSTHAFPSSGTGTTSKTTLSSTANEATSREATKASSSGVGHVGYIVDEQLAYPKLSAPPEDLYHPPVTDHNAERRAAMHAREHTSSGYTELEGDLPLASVSDGPAWPIQVQPDTMPGQPPAHHQGSSGTHMNCVTQPTADNLISVSSEDGNKPEANDPLEVILPKAPFTKNLQCVDPTLENIVNERDCAQASLLPEDASAVPVRVPPLRRTTHTHALGSAGFLSAPSRQAGDGTFGNRFFRGGLETDIVILIMGQTKAGKSSFVNQLLGWDKMAVGESLVSCTRVVEASVVHPPPERYVALNNALGDRRIVFVDTPSFEDTDLGDDEALLRISHWLEAASRRGMLFGGVLYLHDITRDGWTGTSEKSLEIFHKFCSHDLSQISFVTTKWDDISPARLENAVRRATDLKDRKWSAMIAGGASIYHLRHTLAELPSSLIQVVRDPWEIIQAIIVSTNARDISRFPLWQGCLPTNPRNIRNLWNANRHFASLARLWYGRKAGMGVRQLK